MKMNFCDFSCINFSQPQTISKGNSLNNRIVLVCSWILLDKPMLCPNLQEIQIRFGHQTEEVFVTSSGARQNDVNTCVVLPGTHWSARRMRLKSRHLLQPIANLSFVCFICQNFIPSKILSSNFISCNLIYNPNGIFKSWEFYRSCPSAGNKQRVHIVSFPAGRTHSHLRDASWTFKNFLNFIINALIFLVSKLKSLT